MKTNDAVKESGNNRHAVVQTTLRVTETDTDVQVVSDRGIQTVTSTLPETDNQAVIPFLEFTPYSEIEKDSQRVVDLPRKTLLQFELERKIPKKSTSEINPKGVLKKSSSVVEFDSESLIPGVQPNKMSKTQEEQEIQTDLTVNPYILDEDTVANVCTQLATQTSLTFDPADSLSQITSALKKALKHTKHFQAVVIDGKFMTDYVDPNIDEESKISHENIDEEISHTEDEPREDTHSKDVPVSLKSSVRSIPKADTNPAAPLYMTEEEFEANVQKILDKTVKNVYEFMEKIVEMYQVSKEEGKLPPETPFHTPQRFAEDDTEKPVMAPKRLFSPVPEEEEKNEDNGKETSIEAPVTKLTVESLEARPFKSLESAEDQPRDASRMSSALQIATGLIRGPKWILQNALKIDINTGLPLPAAKEYSAKVMESLEESEGAIEFVPIDSQEVEQHFTPKKATPKKSIERGPGHSEAPSPVRLADQPLPEEPSTEETVSPKDAVIEETTPPEEAIVDAKESAVTEEPGSEVEEPVEETVNTGDVVEAADTEEAEETVDTAGAIEAEEVAESGEPAEIEEVADDVEIAEITNAEDETHVEEASSSVEKLVIEETTPIDRSSEEDTVEPSDHPPEETTSAPPQEDIGDSRKKPAADDIPCECSRIHEAGAAPPALYHPCGHAETSIKFEVIVLNDGGIQKSVTEGVVVQASVTRPEQSDGGRDIINVSVTLGGQQIKSPSSQLTIEDVESHVPEEAFEGCSCDDEVTEAQQPAATEAPEANPPELELAETEPMQRAETDPLPESSSDMETEPATEPKPEEAEPIETEPTDAKPIEVEPTETEAVETEQIEAEAVETEPIEAEAVETEPIKAEAVETEPIEAELVPSAEEPMETDLTETEPDDIEPGQTETIETGPAETEAIEAEPAEVELQEAELTKPDLKETESTEGKPTDTEAIELKSTETNPPAEPTQEASTQAEKPVPQPSVSVNVTASFAEGTHTATSVQVSQTETKASVPKIKSKQTAGSGKQSKVTVIVPIQSKSSKVEAKQSSGDHAPECSCRKRKSTCPSDSPKQSEQEIRPPTDYLEQKEIPPEESKVSTKSSKLQSDANIECKCEHSQKPTPSPSLPASTTCDCRIPITPESSTPVCNCRKCTIPEPPVPVCVCHKPTASEPPVPVCGCHKSITTEPLAPVCACQKTVTPKPSVPIFMSRKSVTPKPSTPFCPCHKSVTPKSSAPVCTCQKSQISKSSAPTSSREQPVVSEVPTSIKPVSKNVLPCGCTKPKEKPKQEKRLQADVQTEVCGCGTGIDSHVEKIHSAPILNKKRLCLDKEIQNVCPGMVKNIEHQDKSERMWPYEPPPKKIHQRFSLPSQKVCPCEQSKEVQTGKDECPCSPVAGASQKYKQSIESYIQKLINDSFNARDPGLIQTHIARVGPYLEQIASNLAEEGVSGRPLKCTGDASQQCACSVEVLYINNEPERKDQGCTCSIPREKKPPPQEIHQPAAVKSCNCDLENEPTPNLECMYEQDDDYCEMYMEDLESGDFFRIEPTQSVKETTVCCDKELPPEVIETDRCGSKIEIPWLSIALPPPGTIEIMPTKGPKVVCECWKLDLKDSILSVTEVEQGIDAFKERCVCHDSKAPQAQETETLSPKPEQEKEEGEEEEEAEKRQVQSLSDDDSSSRCNCSEIELDECANFELTNMKFVYDNPCFAQYEPYMDSIYKLFPDDCDTYCGPFTEIHWSEILLPKKVKLREAKRKQEPYLDLRFEKDEGKASMLPFSRMETVESNVTSEIEIELSFAQIASTLMEVEGGAASQQTVSEMSVISDVRMQIKRCPKDYVVTVMADGKPALSEGGGRFGTVGSQPFNVGDFGLGGLIVTVTPSTGYMPPNPPTNIASTGMPLMGIPPTNSQQKSVSVPNLSTATLTSVEFSERYPRAMRRPFVNDYIEEKVVTVQDFSNSTYTCLPCQNTITDDKLPKTPCLPHQNVKVGFPKAKETPREPRQESKKKLSQPAVPVNTNWSIATVESKEFRAKYNIPAPTYADPQCAGLYTIAMPELEPRSLGMETMIAQSRKMTTKQSTSSPGVFQPRQKNVCGTCSMAKKAEAGVCGKIDEVLKPEMSSGPCKSTVTSRTTTREAPINVQEITQKEMKPINQAIDDLKAKLRDMDIPELDAWNRLLNSGRAPCGIPSSMPPHPMSSQYSQLPSQMLYSGPSQFGPPQTQNAYSQDPYMPSLYPPSYFPEQYAYRRDYSMYGSVPFYPYYPYSDSETTEDTNDYICYCTRHRTSPRRKKKRKPPVSSSECSCLSTYSTPSRGTASAKDITSSRRSERNSQVTFSVSNETKIDASNYSDYTQTESEPEVEIQLGKGPPKIKTKSYFKGYIKEDPNRDEISVVSLLSLLNFWYFRIV
ncbi:hypothetical protein Trydic_g6116 [Trypoxylus dichotomus]